MKNEDSINDFINFKTITNKSNKGKISNKTLKKYKDDLTNYSNFLNKLFKQATEKDILNFLSRYEQTTRNGKIIVLRCFYRYLYNLDENEKLPNCIRRIKPIRLKKDEIKYRERIITEEEYDKLLKYATQPIHKAIIEALWITGGRRNAIQSIKSNGVWYDGEFTHVVLSTSKTETREFIHEDRAEYLLLWAEEMQPFKNEENKPLFSVKIKGKENQYKQVNEKYTNKILKCLCEKIPDINKKITPHDFRHTRTTNMLKNGVPETHVKTLLGFTKNTDMLNIYDHNRLKDYQEWLEERKKQTKPTYELLEKQKQTIEEKHQNEINNLKMQLQQQQNSINQFNKLIEKMQGVDISSNSKEFLSDFVFTLADIDPNFDVKKDIKRKGLKQVKKELGLES
jgi:site-specific recombinase XerD